MFYCTPSTFRSTWLADGLIRIRESAVWKPNGRIRCHHVSPWAERYLPADMQRSGAAQKQLIYLADFSSPWLRGPKVLQFLRELYQAAKKLRALVRIFAV